MMNRLSLALLAAITLNFGCSSCAKKPDGETTKPPVPTSSERPVLPSKSTVTAVFFSSKGKAMCWIETSSGTFGGPPETSYWTGQGVIIPENGAYRHYLTDGTGFGTGAISTEGLTPLSEVLKMQTAAPEGYSWEVEEGPGGHEKVFINPALGKKQRLGMFESAPASPAWMEGERPAPRGAEVPPLSKASGFQTREGSGAFQNVGPVGSTPVAEAAVAAEELTAWSATLSELRGGAVTVDLSQSIDLDGDGAAEGFICISGGRGTPCYVVDKVGEQVRYYSTTIQWFPGVAEKPQFFSTDKGSYIMHSPETAVTNKGNGIVRLIRFNGSGYITETIQ